MGEAAEDEHEDHESQARQALAVRWRRRTVKQHGDENQRYADHREPVQLPANDGQSLGAPVEVNLHDTVFGAKHAEQQGVVEERCDRMQRPGNGCREVRMVGTARECPAQYGQQ